MLFAARDAIASNTVSFKAGVRTLPVPQVLTPGHPCRRHENRGNPDASDKIVLGHEFSGASTEEYFLPCTDATSSGEKHTTSLIINKIIQAMS